MEVSPSGQYMENVVIHAGEVYKRKLDLAPIPPLLMAVKIAMVQPKILKSVTQKLVQLTVVSQTGNHSASALKHVVVDHKTADVHAQNQDQNMAEKNVSDQSREQEDVIAELVQLTEVFLHGETLVHVQPHVEVELSHDHELVLTLYPNMVEVDVQNHLSKKLLVMKMNAPLTVDSVLGLRIPHVQ